MPLTAVSVMPLIFSQDEDDSEVYRPCVRLSSAEAELDAAICADRAARALVVSRYGRVRLFVSVSRI